VTNDSSTTIDVTAETPDETLDFGAVAPGETISVDLSEVPSTATLDATPVGSDPSAPSFAPDTLDLGTDYTDAAPFTSIAWEDPSDPALSTDTSTDTSSTDTTTDPSTDGTTDPGATVKPMGSATFVAFRVAPAGSVRIVKPVIVKRT
jgi:hypothetical protein